MMINLPIAKPWFAGAALTYTLRDAALAVVDGRANVAMTEGEGGNFVAVIANVDTLNWPVGTFIFYKDANGLVECEPLFTPANMAQANSTQVALGPTSGAHNIENRIVEESNVIT